ncbi:Methyltransferase ptaH [Lachnellula suecica]|uniref:Methyltransferase ptaH n=1 Tax=Lachnellula suecica TaxID=602035 RepID=A0A8T9CIX1_9HELO|nr:Methyltransferase ptaH [Lachnellula suecica]
MALNIGDEKPGFSGPGYNWDEYIKYRPVYPASHYERIYKYHELHSNSWGSAHDVGAGPGVVSQELATRFEHVVISDPNDEALSIARLRLPSDLLIIDLSSGFSKDTFTFLQERAEHSSVGDNELDMLVIFEAIHWTDLSEAMKSFARQLKKGGTVAISYYGSPHIQHNPNAQEVWGKIFNVWAGKLNTAGQIVVRALRNSNTGLDTVPFPLEDWKAGARRIVINTEGRMNPFKLSATNSNDEPSRVGELDVREFIDRDEGWVERKNVEWLKGLFATFLPRISEEEIQELWIELENAIGGLELEITWPVVLLLATKR